MKIVKWLFVFQIVYLPTLFSQVNDVYSYSQLHLQQANNKSIIGFNSDLYLSSNSVNTKFINAFYSNLYITDDLKNSVKLKDENYFGFKSQSNIYYSTIYDTVLGVANAGYKISLNDYSFTNTKFSKDLFNLVMYGNKMYENKTADISNLEINYLKFQSIEFGVFKHFAQPKNGYHTLFFGFNFIKGQDYQFLYLNKSSLYTAPYGEFVDVELNGAYFGADSVKTNYTSVEGLGASLNFYWAYEDVLHKSRLEISFTELGLVSWYKNPINYYADTTAHFEGVEINDIFNITKQSYSEISKDSIINEVFSEKNNKTFNKSLPKQFNISVTKILFNNKLNSALGLGYIFNANQFMPAIYLNNKYFFSPNFALSLITTYGGYSNFRVGAGVDFKIFKRFNGFLGSTNIMGFFKSENSYSQAAFVNFYYTFGEK
jgi:hypothetical protein